MLRMAAALDSLGRRHKGGRALSAAGAEDKLSRQGGREEEALRRALAEGQFRLHYQPKVSLESGQIMGAEALLRWEDPGRGLVSPLEFIPLAEETGLIVPIGTWAIEEACHRVVEWHRRFPRRPGLVMSVNVSGRQFGPELVEAVAGALAATGAQPGQLCLEVTESVLMGDADAAVGTLRELAATGVKLSMDDFGTGYSSLAYLKRFPLHELKIDRSFVTGLGEDSNETAIVAATVAMAHALGLSVVAEGVETSDQLERLRVLGCQDVQGYFISRPRSAEAFAEFLRDWPSEAGRLGVQSVRFPLSERLLVVDDAEDVRQMARMSLSAAGFEVNEAASGPEALAAVKKTLPDCVLLDVSMPHMSGFDVCRALRANPATVDCTIVMLTSNAASADKVQAFSCGADDYIIKPFTPRDLVGRVRAAIHRRRDPERPAEHLDEQARLG